MIAALAQHGGHLGVRAGQAGGQGRDGIADSAAEQPRQSQCGVVESGALAGQPGGR
jgi:hypothetical protein